MNITFLEETQVCFYTGMSLVRCLYADFVCDFVCICMFFHTCIFLNSVYTVCAAVVLIMLCVISLSAVEMKTSDPTAVFHIHQSVWEQAMWIVYLIACFRSKPAIRCSHIVYRFYNAGVKCQYKNILVSATSFFIMQHSTYKADVCFGHMYVICQLSFIIKV